jgi:hypothetical protein
VGEGGGGARDVQQGEVEVWGGATDAQRQHVTDSVVSSVPLGVCVVGRCVCTC